ncbi:unnamed protein product [Blepharisma stoltei]|uniref:RING-type domain-containing protein n=1 Tax=Blepharisma stoltei TaxID=1481888 RepID=A0AAU9KGR7_9CILI|nr:unnamed protein product [Blepharisma stoltei]
MTESDSIAYVEIVEADIDDPILVENYRHDDLSLKEGYEIDRFIEPPRKDFLCPVCLGVVRNPLECVQCGSLLCKKCFLEIISSSHANSHLRLIRTPIVTCPICRSLAVPREPSILLLKYINNLQIACKNKNQGCGEICCLANIKEHQKTCQFSTVSCANQQFCNKRGTKNEFITVNFPKPRINSYFNDSRIRKGKLVCSEICKRVMIMKNALDSGQINEPRAMHHDAIKELLSLS